MRLKEGMIICKDIIFPIFCVGCDAEGEWVCQRCLETIDVNGFFACPLCHQTTEDGVVCRWCRPASSLEQIVAMGVYDTQSALGRLIHSLKYAYAVDCMRTIQECITLFLEEYASVFQSVDAIIPVPLHRRRYAERGFNQAALIAYYLSTQLGIPVYDSVKRVRYTLPQAKQKREQRWMQMKDAFLCSEPDVVRGKNILIIDDVYTTGATMHHCALALEKVGAKTVSGFVLARG